MAEKKPHKIVSASTGKTVTRQAASGGQSTVGLRIGAIALWILAIVCEVIALMVIFETLIIPFLSNVPPLYQGIGFLVLDLIFVIIGSQLWKKANHINPASRSNEFLFWLWNNMGVIVAAIAFLPFIIILLKSDNVDPKTKTIGSIAAAVALLISGAASYDFNPVSAEDFAAMGLGSAVYWTPYGTVFHSHEDCSALSRTATLTTGSINEAEDAGRERLCKYCEKRDSEAGVLKQLPAPNQNKNLDKPKDNKKEKEKAKDKAA